jgi:cbb3-type cytochrome oxidase cytochrome c subunit
MPAGDQTIWDQKKLHVVFAVTSVILLISTFWLFWKDHAREWKQYQAEARVIDIQITEWRQLETQTDGVVAAIAQAQGELDVAAASKIDGLKSAEDLIARIDAFLADTVNAEDLSDVIAVIDIESMKAPEATWKTASTESATAARAALTQAIDNQIALIKAKEDARLVKVKFQRANRDQAAADEGLAVRDGDKEAELAAHAILLEIRNNPVDGLNVKEGEYERVAKFRKELKALSSEFQTVVKEKQKLLDAANSEKVRLQAAIDERHSALWEGKWLGKKWLELPILDAFNSPLKIDNLWSDDLEQSVNFQMVRRFDRCTTCHQMMEKSVPGAALDPAFVAQRTIEIRLDIPPATEASTDLLPDAGPQDVPTPAESQVGRQKALENVFGMRFAPTGLINYDDVTVAYVATQTPAKNATVIEPDYNDVTYTGQQILDALLQSSSPASPIKNTVHARDTRPGLEIGDVIISIDGDLVHDPDLVAHRLLAAQGETDSVVLLVRRGLPQPFNSHPRLDLFVGSLSPHKIQEFGCTICHEGQGSATDFKWASHTPNDPLDRSRWMGEHGWFDNHHWIYPQYPARFIESTCLKCHHDVTELEPSERFEEAPAPKVVRGYNTIRKFGCYGCHEINGFDGPDKRIGPDMRVEPNYSAAALQLKADAGFAHLSSVDQQLVNRLVTHPEDDAARHDLLQVIEQDVDTLDAVGESILSDDSHGRIAAVLADVDVPGSLRKPGPSLRYVGAKNGEAFLYDWIANPQSFRSSSRMPRFFNLHNHLPDSVADEAAAKFEPIELLGMVHYLKSNTQSFDYLAWDKDVTADADRGKIAFQQRGCLACHSHHDETLAGIEEYRNPDEFLQGPDLSELGAKFAGVADAQKWLYSWIKQPTKYHARTVMPDLFIDVEITTHEDGTETKVDPALDIAAFLLSDVGAWTVGENILTVAKLKASETLQANLSELVQKNLEDSFYRQVAAKYAESGIPANASGVKVAERLLQHDGDATGLDPETKLRYIGRKALAKYGCYGCHDIPGFEDAKPIGAGLADWGRKDPSKLAFEHIAQYLDGHDDHASHDDDGHAGHEHGEVEAERDIKPSRYDADMPDFYHEQMHAHNRTGFIYQKLREPRSYDYHKAAGKKYSERLRMPQFPLSTADRESIITFVLGLVSEPPREKYLYKPSVRTKALIDGKQVLDKFNCAGCHVLEPEKWKLTLSETELQNVLAQHVEIPKEYPLLRPDVSAQELAESMQQDARGNITATFKGMPAVGNQGLASANDAEFGDPIEDYLQDRFRLNGVGELQFQLWDYGVLNGGVAAAGSNLSRIAPTAVSQRTSAHGGVLARYLLPIVTNQERLVNPEAKGAESWAWVPPPLVGQGSKVQNQWFHDFLLEPYRIRPAVVLRMPKFNMSSVEATKIVNYFAARDNANYPYEFDPRVNGDHLAEVAAAYQAENGANSDRLADAMQIVVSQDYCIKCHSMGDFEPEGSVRGRAPNLGMVHKRLRAGYVQRWIARPSSILPYTAMPQNVPYDEAKPYLGAEQTQKLFHGTSPETVDALVDLLMNFDGYAKSRASVAGLVAEAKAAKEAALKEAEAAKEAETPKETEAVPEKLPVIEAKQTEGL